MSDITEPTQVLGKRDSTANDLEDDACGGLPPDAHAATSREGAGPAEVSANETTTPGNDVVSLRSLAKETTTAGEVDLEQTRRAHSLRPLAPTLEPSSAHATTILPHLPQDCDSMQSGSGRPITASQLDRTRRGLDARAKEAMRGSHLAAIGTFVHATERLVVRDILRSDFTSGKGVEMSVMHAMQVARAVHGLDDFSCEPAVPHRDTLGDESLDGNVDQVLCTNHALPPGSSPQVLSQLSSESVYLNSSHDCDKLEDSDETQRAKAAHNPALPAEETCAAIKEKVDADEEEEEEMSLTLEMSDELGREATQMVAEEFDACDMEDAAAKCHAHPPRPAEVQQRAVEVTRRKEEAGDLALGEEGGPRGVTSPQGDVDSPQGDVVLPHGSVIAPQQNVTLPHVGVPPATTTRGPTSEPSIGPASKVCTAEPATNLASSGSISVVSATSLSAAAEPTVGDKDYNTAGGASSPVGEGALPLLSSQPRSPQGLAKPVLGTTRQTTVAAKVLTPTVSVNARQLGPPGNDSSGAGYHAERIRTAAVPADDVDELLEYENLAPPDLLHYKSKPGPTKLAFEGTPPEEVVCVPQTQSPAGSSPHVAFQLPLPACPPHNNILNPNNNVSNASSRITDRNAIINAAQGEVLRDIAAQPVFNALGNLGLPTYPHPSSQASDLATPSATTVSSDSVPPTPASDLPSSSEKQPHSPLHILQEVPISHASDASKLRRAALAKQLGVDVIRERARLGTPLEYPLAKRDASKRLWRAASSGEVQVESDIANRDVAASEPPRADSAKSAGKTPEVPTPRPENSAAPSRVEKTRLGRRGSKRRSEREESLSGGDSIEALSEDEAVCRRAPGSPRSPIKPLWGKKQKANSQFFGGWSGSARNNAGISHIANTPTQSPDGSTKTTCGGESLPKSLERIYSPSFANGMPHHSPSSIQGAHLPHSCRPSSTTPAARTFPAITPPASPASSLVVSVDPTVSVVPTTPKDARSSPRHGRAREKSESSGGKEKDEVGERGAGCKSRVRARAVQHILDEGSQRDYDPFAFPDSQNDQGAHNPTTPQIIVGVGVAGKGAANRAPASVVAEGIESPPSGPGKSHRAGSRQARMTGMPFKNLAAGIEDVEDGVVLLESWVAAAAHGGRRRAACGNVQEENCTSPEVHRAWASISVFAADSQCTPPNVREDVESHPSSASSDVQIISFCPNPVPSLDPTPRLKSTSISILNPTSITNSNPNPPSNSNANSPSNSNPIPPSNPNPNPTPDHTPAPKANSRPNPTPNSNPNPSPNTTPEPSPSSVSGHNRSRSQIPVSDPGPVRRRSSASMRRGAVQITKGAQSSRDPAPPARNPENVAGAKRETRVKKTRRPPSPSGSSPETAGEPQRKGKTARRMTGLERETLGDAEEGRQPKAAKLSSSKCQKSHKGRVASNPDHHSAESSPEAEPVGRGCKRKAAMGTGAPGRFRDIAGMRTRASANKEKQAGIAKKKKRDPVKATKPGSKRKSLGPESSRNAATKQGPHVLSTDDVVAEEALISQDLGQLGAPSPPVRTLRMSTFLKGMAFLITGYEKERTAAKDMENMIKKHGGFLLNAIPSVDMSQRRRSIDSGKQLFGKQIVVVTPKLLHTVKCLYAMAAGLPLVRPAWLTDSIKEKCRLDFQHPDYALLLGPSRAGGMFCGMSLLLHGEPAWRAQFSLVLQHAGAVVMTMDCGDVDPSCHNKELQCVVLAADTPAGEPLARLARRLKLPCVTHQWVVESLVEGAVLEWANFTVKGVGAPPQPLSSLRLGARSSPLHSLPPASNADASGRKAALPQLAPVPHQPSFQIRSTLSDLTSHDDSGEDSDSKVVWKKACAPRGRAAASSRTYYRSFVRKGVEYKVGDTVLLRPSEQPDGPPYVAKLEALYTSHINCPRNEAQCKWFYRPEDTMFKGIAASPAEVFASEHVDDEVPVGSIMGKCEVRFTSPKEPAPVAAADPAAEPLFVCRLFYNHDNETLECLAV